jgi:hypothetical protein
MGCNILISPLHFALCFVSKGEGFVAKKAKAKRKKLGNWKVRRVGQNQLMVTIPTGMKVSAKGPISIEDVLGGIANYIAAKKNPRIACCSVSLMVA